MAVPAAAAVTMGAAVGAAVGTPAVIQMRRGKILFFYYAIRVGGRNEN